jgi:hypothetical protein
MQKPNALFCVIAIVLACAGLMTASPLQPLGFNPLLQVCLFVMQTHDTLFSVF